MDVVKAIINLQEKHNISTNKLATLSGLSQSTVQSVVGRGNIPSIPTLEKILPVFGLTLHEFFAPEDDPPELSPELNELVREAKSLPPDKLHAVINIIKAMK